MIVLGVIFWLVVFLAVLWRRRIFYGTARAYGRRRGRLGPVIRLSKGETSGLAKLLNETPDEGFIALWIQRRTPQADVLVTIERRNKRGHREMDKTVIGPRGGRYYP